MGTNHMVTIVQASKTSPRLPWSAAQRVPPDNVVAVGNSFTIRKMNLSDPERFLYSPGITKLAEENGWWSPMNDPPGMFDFFGAYGYTPEGGNPETTKLLKDTLSF